MPQEVRYSAWPWSFTSLITIAYLGTRNHYSPKPPQPQYESLCATAKQLSLADPDPDRRSPRHLAIFLDHPHVVITRRLPFARRRVFPMEATLTRIPVRPFGVAHRAVADYFDPVDR